MTKARNEAFIQSEIFSDSVDRADILIGIVSDARTADIQIPLVKSYEGLIQDYPGLSSAIAFCDSTRKEGLKDQFLGAPCPVPRIYQATESGHEKKITSLFNLMHLARRLKAKVVIALDGDLTSVKRTWISRLAQPIIAGNADYTAPFYHSLTFDTPVTNIFGYPMFRALFGRRIRQPFLTDRAFSGELNEHYLANRDWPLDLPYSATEMTLTILSITKKARICQSYMATPRLSWQSTPLDAGTGHQFRKVALSLFSLTDLFKDVWLNCKRSKPTNITGTELAPSVIAPRTISPPEVFMDEIAAIVDQYSGLWHDVFNGRKDWIFQKLVNEPAESMSVGTEDWVHVCYKSAVAFQTLGDEARADFLRALTAVFYGRLLTWLQSGKGLSMPQMEALTEKECGLFEAKRHVFADDWARTQNRVNLIAG
jgi:hypothetical protein